MNSNVVDTHRLMYRNARLRALDLSDRTSQLSFYNITEDNPDGDDIGTIVYTDSNGYLFYGNAAQQITSLCVKQSAIIQVDLHNSNAWDIEWVVAISEGDQYVQVGDIGRMYFSDGTEAWNPVGHDFTLPDYMRRDEFHLGIWAEGELHVTETTPKELNVDNWTHTIVIAGAHGLSYGIGAGKGRSGQVITVLNKSETSVEFYSYKFSWRQSVILEAGEMCVAVKVVEDKWYLQKIPKSAATAASMQIIPPDQPDAEWDGSITFKLNESGDAARSGGQSNYMVPPNGLCTTLPGNVPAYVMQHSGVFRVANGSLTYDPSDEWGWRATGNNYLSPAWCWVVGIGSNSFPADHKLGSYNGVNKVRLWIKMVPGESLIVRINIGDDIFLDSWIARDVAFFINDLRIWKRTVTKIEQDFAFLWGRVDCYRNENGRECYTWTPFDIHSDIV